MVKSMRVARRLCLLCGETGAPGGDDSTQTEESNDQLTSELSDTTMLILFSLILVFLLCLTPICW